MGMKKMRVFLLSIFLVVYCISAATAAPSINPEMEKIFKALQSKDRDTVAASVASVVQRADEVPSFLLFLASAKAIALNDIENAGFLFYTAQIRSQFDLQRFPPFTKGGESPATTLGALKDQIGAVVKPRVFRQPSVYSRIVQRLEQWVAVTKSDYSPGWEYQDEGVGGKDIKGWEKEAFRKFKSDHLVFARGFAKLLNMQEYFDAFKSVQQYNSATQAYREIPKNKATMKNAENTMKKIEKRLKINGMYFKGDDS